MVQATILVRGSLILLNCRNRNRIPLTLPTWPASRLRNLSRGSTSDMRKGSQSPRRVIYGIASHADGPVVDNFCGRRLGDGRAGIGPAESVAGRIRKGQDA